MIGLPSAFIDRMKEQLGEDYAAFAASYDRQPYKALRVNVAKISVEEFLKISPFDLQPVPWTTNGFYVQVDKPGRHPFHQAGLYYCQEPSAMSAAPLADVQDGERVLDLCSAPGGKGTELAARNPHGVTVLNEIFFSRAKILSQNVERLGLNAVVTCAPPDKLAKDFPAYFDKIVVDAPCSGEGMFLKEDAAIPEWSAENVKMCAERQAEILQSAHEMLAKGGLLVYSTCTFSCEEDEEQVAAFLRLHPEYALLKQSKLYPHQCKGEGHFIALLQKGEGERRDKKVLEGKMDKKQLALYRDFEKSTFGDKLVMPNLCMVGTQLYSLPDDCPKTQVQVLRAGIHLGEFVKDRFEPSHALAMFVPSAVARCVEVDDKLVTDYFAGLTFPCQDAFKGWCLVTYHGFAVGWCKAVNGMAKNHYPKGLRIS